MANEIVIKNGTTTPDSDDGNEGELLYNKSADKLYISTSDGATPTEIGNTTYVPLAGGTMTGTLNMSAQIAMADSQKIKLGNSNDLQIHHNGTDSIINDTGTGDLKLYGSKIVIGDAGENCAEFEADGEVKLYSDNKHVMETHDSGIRLIGGEGGEAILKLDADQGDDDSDKWRIRIATNGGFNIDSYATGSWVDVFSSKTDGRLAGECFLDEDDMASNSAFKIASQQSIKAYVDENRETVMGHNFYMTPSPSGSPPMIYVPFFSSSRDDTDADESEVDDQVFIAPYDGKLTKVLLYNDYSATAQPGTVTVKMELNGGSLLTLSSLFHNWMQDTVMDYYINQNNTFSKHDIIRLGLQSAAWPRYVSMTTVWQFDRTT